MGIGLGSEYFAEHFIYDGNCTLYDERWDILSCEVGSLKDTKMYFLCKIKCSKEHFFFFCPVADTVL